MKKVVKEDNQNYWKDKIKPLLIQGNLMKLLIEQEENITWKSIIYSLPKGVMKFAINAAMDTLPTFTNLQRWGKRLNGRCPLCKNRGTLHHILNNCTQALDRYTWRHDSTLSVITNMLKNSDEFKAGKFKIYADLKDDSPKGTIPPHILPTTSRPDIVLVWPDKIRCVELTVPFEPNIKNAHERKCNKYASLEFDLKERICDSSVVCVEVGSRGLVDKENGDRFKELIKLTKSKVKPKELVKDLSKVSLLCSFSIFYAKEDPVWSDIPVLLLK